MEHEDLIVSMKGIQKSFGGVHALTDGELTLRKGEVLGLIGENGAGKSTLMKILSGVYQADAGVMLVDGKEVHYHEPRQALHDGICMIYQELNLVQHMPIWAALIITVLVTTVFGVLNGFLVSCCKIPPFVATMGTQYLAQGIGYIVSRVQTMRYPVVTSPDGWFKRVFYKSLNGFPMGVIYMVILFVIASFIFRYTKIGKYACAIGSNCEATRLSGVDTRRWTMLVYIIAGVFAGLAGIFYSATYTSVLPGSGSGMEMNAIAAVVIGGTSLSGGSGTMLGTIIGVFIMAVLKNGLMTIGIQQQWQVFFTGLAVLLAVMLDIYRSVKLKRS